MCLAGALSLGCPRAAEVRSSDVAAREPPGEFVLRLPPGFPEPVIPEDNPITAAKIELGRYLFFDRRLSANETQSCADCHRRELAFTDGRARAVGSTGELHPRGAMSLAHVAYGATLTWADNGIRRLEDQALIPMFNEHPVELGVAGNERTILRRFQDDRHYVAMFGEAFPGQDEPIRIDNVARALASFERTLLSGDSPYHRLLYRGEMDALSPSARRGLDLFFSEAIGCSRCHDGITVSGPIVFEQHPDTEPTFHNTGLYDVDGKGSYPEGNRGLFEITGAAEDMGRFRAPTLCNVALTAPYMHDGSLASLEEVIDFYAAGGSDRGKNNPFKSELIRGFDITPSEKADLIHFLESLTDTTFVSDPRHSNPFDDVGLRSKH